MRKPKLFIASSGRQSAIVDELTIALGDHFEVTPWTLAFPAGQLTMQTLVEARDKYDCAVCIFAHDDEMVTEPGNGGTDSSRRPIARDNVVLEFGLFLGTHGPQRVLILAEAGVDIPSDLAALTVLPYKATPAATRKAQLAQHSETIRNQWTPMPPSAPPQMQPPDDHGLGFTSTIKDIEDRTALVRRNLHASGATRKAVANDPVRFDLTDECEETYVEAMNLTRQRFWVTTYISSEFWIKPSLKVVAANQELCTRLGKKGNLRRLFMLSYPFEQALEQIRDERTSLKRAGRSEELASRNDKFKRQVRQIATQKEAGFEVRVCYDDESTSAFLPRESYAVRLDTEVAVFDQFRVDFYHGVKHGRIQRVHCFTPMVHNFREVLRAAEEYYGALWENAKEVDEAMDEIRRTHADVDRQVDYEPQWLAEFEFGLRPDDSELKVVELARIQELLRSHGQDRISSMLDIGTCTARYPLALADLVDDGGSIIGIDADPDCVRFAEGYVRTKKPSKPIEIVRRDFLRPHEYDQFFGLITCTLGTLSHFGHDRKPDFADDLQKALVKMRELLEANGVLFLSNWSDTATNGEKLLEIYRPADRKRLAANTPSAPELRDRLRAAGLRIIEEADCNQRIDVFMCQRA